MAWERQGQARTSQWEWVSHSLCRRQVRQWQILVCRGIKGFGWASHCTGTDICLSTNPLYAARDQQGNHDQHNFMLLSKLLLRTSVSFACQYQTFKVKHRCQQDLSSSMSVTKSVTGQFVEGKRSKFNYSDHCTLLCCSEIFLPNCSMSYCSEMLQYEKHCGRHQLSHIDEKVDRQA